MPGPKDKDEQTTASSQEVWLRLEGVPRSQWGYAIQSEAQTIGRSPGCHIRVGDPTVSREHAVVWLKEGVPYIRDLESINGTRVNDNRIRTSVLMPGDLIQVGQIALRVESAAGPDPVPQSPNRVASIPQIALVKASASAAGQYTPTNLEEAKLREDLAAMYSLGGTLSLCSSRSEALHQLFDWMRSWLGVDQAAAVFHINGQLKVTARNWSHGPAGPDEIYWPTVKACLAQRQLVSHELLRPRDADAAQEGERPNHILAAWIPGGTPPGVIYSEWLAGDMVWDKRCRELFDAAARVLGEALTRLGGGKPRTDQDPGASWMFNVEPDLIVGGAGMEPVREFIRRAAGVDAIVLITGETGTGKELVARAIHQRSGRAKGPFVARNCSAFAESLLEDELFGHEPGAFTGATQHRKGVFDQAHRGSLLLDEIADTTAGLQAKLLRVLEEQCFQRVGGQQSVQVDVRIIAATNRDLLQAVECGQFRRDLFYRLEVLTVHLPPLRVRPEDVRALADHFVDLACQRWNLPRLPLNSDAVHKLESHNWPGNVREVRNAIDRAVLLSEGATQIQAEHILISQSAAAGNSPSNRIEDMEHEHILQVLASVGGNRARAATMLGIDRSTLIRKLRRFSADTVRNE